jgi:CheY-like chemotaxis protein
MMAKIDILIIDDSPAFNHLTKLIIDRAGIDCHIIELSNGQRALKYLAETDHLPDVILLDINMPVMDGFDFLDEYSHTSKYSGHSHIYMLTSSSQDIDRLKVRAFGIVKDYFEKPLTKENLLQIMSNLKDDKKG